MDGGSPDGSDLGSPHTFLGLDEVDEGPWDVVILPVPYEMTTSWGEGTEPVSYTHLTLPTKA